MKLSYFIAGVLGVIGFVVSVVAGLMADNSLDTILLKAMALGVGCYVVGFVVGLIAEQVSTEHAHQLAKKVAEQDAAEEITRLEKQAAVEAESAERAAADTPMSVPAKT